MTDFQATPTFNGPREGFVFSTGAKVRSPLRELDDEPPLLRPRCSGSPELRADPAARRGQGTGYYKKRPAPPAKQPARKRAALKRAACAPAPPLPFTPAARELTCRRMPLRSGPAGGVAPPLLKDGDYVLCAYYPRDVFRIRKIRLSLTQPHYWSYEIRNPRLVGAHPRPPARRLPRVDGAPTRRRCAQATTTGWRSATWSATTRRKGSSTRIEPSSGWSASRALSTPALPNRAEPRASARSSSPRRCSRPPPRRPRPHRCVPAPAVHAPGPRHVLTARCALRTGGCARRCGDDQLRGPFAAGGEVRPTSSGDPGPDRPDVRHGRER